MIEKLVSLIRFSFSENTLLALASKIRHFYDLYFLANDPECAKYIQTNDFLKDFRGLLRHDQLAFDEPAGWQTKSIDSSPLITDFPVLWEKLRTTYQNELSLLAFTAIPNENEVANTMSTIFSVIQGNE